MQKKKCKDRVTKKKEDMGGEREINLPFFGFDDISLYSLFLFLYSFTSSWQPLSYHDDQLSLCVDHGP